MSQCRSPSAVSTEGRSRAAAIPSAPSCWVPPQKQLRGVHRLYSARRTAEYSALQTGGKHCDCYENTGSTDGNAVFRFFWRLLPEHTTTSAYSPQSLGTTDLLNQVHCRDRRKTHNFLKTSVVLYHH